MFYVNKLLFFLFRSVLVTILKRKFFFYFCCVELNVPKKESWILEVLFAQVLINSFLNCKIFISTFIMRTLRIYKNRLK